MGIGPVRSVAMYQHDAVTEAEHRDTADDGPVAPTGAATVGQTGPRTAAGAVVMAAVPVVVAVVVVAPVVAMVATAAVGGGRYVHDQSGTEPSTTDPPTPTEAHDRTGVPAD